MIRKSIFVLFLGQLAFNTSAHPHHPGVFNAHDAALIFVLLMGLFVGVLISRKSLKKRGQLEHKQGRKQERTQL